MNYLSELTINLIIILIVLLVNFGINKVTGASIDKGIGG